MTGRGLGAAVSPVPAMRQDVRDFKVMQQARGAAEAMGRIAAVKNRRLERLAGFEHVAEVEGIEAAGDAHRVQLVLLDGDAPGAAPCQRAEPDFAVILVGGFAGLDRKPRIGLMAGGSAAAFDDARAGMQRLLVQGPLARPAAGQIVQRVVGGRQGPGGGSGLLDGDRLRLAILDGRRARQDAAVRIDGVVQGDENIALDVLEYDVKAVRRFTVWLS